MKNSLNAMLEGHQLSQQAYRILLTEAVGRENVITAPEELLSYATALNGSQVLPVAVVLPTTEAQVVALMMQANRYRFSLYPLSRGKNFGYGTAQGTAPGQVIVDLSQMNEVLEVNEELGYVVLQPGVSQKQLHDYLHHHSSRLRMDATGAGEAASVVGNVLERGFGHTDYGNRFDNILNLRVVLPTGEVISTGYGDFPEAQAAHTYRHGIGPSIDGLFTQSNLGIVTQMTLALQPRAECDRMFAFLANGDEALEQLIERVRELKLAGVVTSAVHVANQGRLEKPGRDNKVGAWNVSGVLSGPKAVVKAKQRQVKRAFKGIPGRLYFISQRTLQFMGWVDRHLKPIPVYEDLREIMHLKQGIPTERYIKDLMADDKAASENLHEYVKHQCFRWISAVAPAEGKKVWEMVGLTEVCMAFSGYRFRATLTFVTPRAVIMISEFTYPNSPEAQQRAKEDNEECVSMLAEAGYYAYRSGPGSYEKVMPDGVPLYDTLKKMKQALDPKQVLAPGKYML